MDSRYLEFFQIEQSFFKIEKTLSISNTSWRLQHGFKMLSVFQSQQSFFKLKNNSTHFKFILVFSMDSRCSEFQSFFKVREFFKFEKLFKFILVSSVWIQDAQSFFKLSRVFSKLESFFKFEKTPRILNSFWSLQYGFKMLRVFSN